MFCTAFIEMLVADRILKSMFQIRSESNDYGIRAPLCMLHR